MKFVKLTDVAIFILCITLNYSCNQTEKVVKQIHQNALNSDKSYQVLDYLCRETAGRLPGTPQSAKAIEFIKQTLKKYGADSVWLVPINAPGWSELKKPVTSILLDNEKSISLNSISLGQSVSTLPNGIEALIVVIDSKTQIDSLGEKGLKGKIVFFNQKMQVRTDYGKCGWQRLYGASMVSKYGALGVLVRSLTTKKDDKPHTGVVWYDTLYQKIPAVALSWQAADTLEKYLSQNPNLKIKMLAFCNNPGLIPSYNVVGEIKGSKYPNEIYLLTAHIDTWHNTQGAHDNSGGLAQVTDVIRIFKELNIKPKHTIRVMAYIDEEQQLNGMVQYAIINAKNNQTHVLDIEVDYGIGKPTGFNIQADSAAFTKKETIRKYLELIKSANIKFTNSYATGWPLYAKDKTILAHLVCKDDQYFDYHHSENDIFESVDKTNLQLGSSSLAAFIYILDNLEVIDNSERIIGNN